MIQVVNHKEHWMSRGQQPGTLPSRGGKWARGQQGKDIRAELCCPALKIQTGTPSSFLQVMQTYDPCMPLGVLDCFCKEEMSSTPLSKPDVFRYVGFTLCIQARKIVLYYLHVEAGRGHLKSGDNKLHAMEVSERFPWEQQKHSEVYFY